MIGVTLRYKWIPWAMFVGPGLEPVLPSGRLSCLVLSPLGGGERKGKSFFFHNASNGPIEAFLSVIHAFSSKQSLGRILWIGLPVGAQKHTVRVVLFKKNCFSVAGTQK